ncbi:MAG: trpD [Rickettsiaceae bacterium]|jgi:anthranilate phosphoribosyltransferase|nr:trpD [Rickettsiaceae bacterium]
MNGIKKYIEQVVNYQNLTEEDSARAFQIIMNGGANPSEIAAFLVALRMKGETIDEIVGAATVMRQKAEKISVPVGAIDTCGTGGKSLNFTKKHEPLSPNAGKAGTFNVSTTVAFVVAACGVPVAKHGNKAASSLSGSADVLRELGVNVDADTSLMEQALSEAGICFMMAPKFHTAMRHVAPVRRELGIRTIFNILGPLSNPAAAKYQLMGVYSQELVEPLAHVLARLGVARAWVVHGEDGIDEITITGKTFVAELNDGNVRTFEIDPEGFGIELVEIDELRGGDANANAQQMKAILRGKGNAAYRSMVLLNAAAALVVAEKAADLKAGIELAEEAIDSGRANEVLQQLVAISSQVVGDN